MNKLKIGFGPKTTANSFTQSGVKVAQVLDTYDGIEASCFENDLTFDALSKFDVLVFIKIIPSYEILKQLKDAGKVLILDYQDMFLYPSVYERNIFKRIAKQIVYFPQETMEKQRLQLFDRCLVSSPVSEKLVAQTGMTPKYIIRQIYNDKNEMSFKRHSVQREGLNILWTGVDLNLKQNEEIEPILKDICLNYKCKVIYLCNTDQNFPEWVQVEPWSLDTWEDVLLKGDIAFRWWSMSNDQYHKDSNKIISYMAAGLPVVCKPTASDKTVIKDKENGFFVHSVKDFEKAVVRLIENPDLRQKVGLTAHKEVWAKYSLKTHVLEIKELIESLVSQKKGKFNE